MSSSNSHSQSQKPSINYGSPCAACKFLRRKCLPDCIFAPHFPADQPKKFEAIHTIYGASNVSKLLNQLSYDERDKAAKSLIYEAEAWQRDPVHGCVGFISILQKRLNELQIELAIARRELSTYIVSEAPQDANAFRRSN
ncbi:protein ASYMMETRIC LEAVES 2-like [Benincasa hispida]|uniref:protein ASYMMETRIC LEAVES 2-like n=1 Tax=Benincasa hispida TaxID=102211 RepID=UPI0019001B82|nr:protein ASYMMETRIC LEAVES 2-like [Benincasa hispida]